ncbi:hypothetical protein B4U80_13407 [Leptotrombidium deliense]|uniref:C-type lectin domain-containing protein n=1 Tax=Leptotrombidium deliense TaxID=299467 RepID=A0A443S6Z5_9ACAR|nr:hypothetical protein B4U80_13407 [Leptotrombidium deliense]
MKYYCESINGSLPVIHSYRDNVLLEQSFPAFATFLGAVRDGEDWDWIDGKNHTYYRWTEGEPNNSGGRENCIVFENGGNHQGHWNDVPCSYVEHTVCVLDDCDAFIANEKYSKDLKIKKYVENEMAKEEKKIFDKLMTHSEIQLNDVIESKTFKQSIELKKYIDSNLKNESNALFHKIVAAMGKNTEANSKKEEDMIMSTI